MEAITLLAVVALVTAILLTLLASHLPRPPLPPGRRRVALLVAFGLLALTPGCQDDGAAFQTQVQHAVEAVPGGLTTLVVAALLILGVRAFLKARGNAAGDSKIWDFLLGLIRREAASGEYQAELNRLLSGIEDIARQHDLKIVLRLALAIRAAINDQPVEPLAQAAVAAEREVVARRGVPQNTAKNAAAKAEPEKTIEGITVG